MERFGQYSQGHLGGGLVSTVRIIVEGVWSVQTVSVTVSTDSQGYGQYRQSGLWSVQTVRVMVITDSQGYGQYSQGYGKYRQGYGKYRQSESLWSGFSQYRQGHHGEVWSVQSGSSWRGLVSTDRVIMERFGKYR